MAPVSYAFQPPICAHINLFTNLFDRSMRIAFLYLPKIYSLLNASVFDVIDFFSTQSTQMFESILGVLPRLKKRNISNKFCAVTRQLMMINIYCSTKDLFKEKIHLLSKFEVCTFYIL